MAIDEQKMEEAVGKVFGELAVAGYAGYDPATGAFTLSDEMTLVPAGPGHGYDLVCFTDSLHDLGDPVAAAAHARSVLAPGGTVLEARP